LPDSKKTSEFDLLEEIAKVNPYLQNIEKYFPGWESAFTPTAIGLTKLQGAKSLVAPFRNKILSELERKELLEMVKFWNRLPPKFQSFIKKIQPSSKRKDGLEAVYSKGVVTLPETAPSLEDTIHELLHGVQDFTAKKRGGSLNKILKKAEKLGWPEALDTESAIEELAWKKRNELLGGIETSMRPIYKEIVKQINYMMKVK